ncbi:MAG: CoA-binding protein, partial [Candidatus Lindowbacteria bacterium]|nr:CoA-binding protein [Candidatus Lindowbacteria bacterium]
MTIPANSQGLRTDFDALFKPQSVAHVGASPRSAPGRFNYTAFLRNMKYAGKLYPVNPKHDEIFDLPCYPNLAAVPEAIDLAILAVPAVHCPEILRGVPAGKVKFAVIHTSGFGEIDKRGLESEILQTAREKRFRIVGPNCMGVYSQQGRVGFWRDHWEIVDRPGSIGFISQSGGHAVNVILSGMDAGVNFNKVISLGNQLDVSINELLEYMGNDATIGAIGVYVEDVRDGRQFLRLLNEISGRKPVVVWKGGLTTAGKAAAATHTGSIAGNNEIFDAAMCQAGVITVDNFHQLLRLLRLLQPEFKLPGGRVAIFSPGGGNTVSICDLFSAHPNLSLPRLSSETQERLKALLPEENVDTKNPIDPGAVGTLRLDQLLKVVGADPQIESLMVLMSVDYLSNIETEENRVLAVEMISNMFSRYAQRIDKPIYALLQQHRQNHEDFDRYRRLMVAKFNGKHIPWIDGSFKEVAEVFSKLVQYRARKGMMNDEG